MRYKETSDTIREARLNAGLSLRKASKKVGVSVTTLMKWEEGTTSPSLENAKRLCEAYGISIKDLIR